MPTYEYQCDKCGGEFDFFQSIKEAPKDTCEKCGGHLTKLLSAGTGLIFKGSGFYITDYKGGSGKVDSGSGSGSSEGGAKSEGKSAGDKSGGGSGESKATAGESKSSSSDPKPKSPAPAKSSD